MITRTRSSQSLAYAWKWYHLGYIDDYRYENVAIFSGGDKLTQRWISYDAIETGQGRVIKFQKLM